MSRKVSCRERLVHSKIEEVVAAMDGSDACEVRHGRSDCTLGFSASGLRGGCESERSACAGGSNGSCVEIHVLKIPVLNPQFFVVFLPQKWIFVSLSYVT